MRPQIKSTLVVGHPRSESRTVGVACHVTKMIRTALGEEGVDVAEPDVVHLAELAADLLGWVGEPNVPRVEQGLALVRRPGLLIVVSPVFKGAYSGLLKLLFDLLPMRALESTVAVPLMTAGWEQHRAVVDTHMRALLLELGALAPVRGLTVLENEFTNLDAAVGPWAARSIPPLAAVISRVQWHKPTPDTGGSTR